MRFDVVTFGSAVVDVFVDTDIAEKGKFMCYPVGAKILLKNLKFDIGGGGTNTAVAFSRLGFKTGYIGKIGDDTDGQTILKLLKKEKIKFLGKIKKNAISGYSIILDSRAHNRTILTYKGVNETLELDEIKKFSTRWLYCSSFLGKSLETQKKLANILAKKGTKIAFNPSLYLIKRTNLLPLLKITEILIMNKEEAELLCKKNKVKGKNLLLRLHSLGPRIVVITDKNNPIKCYDGKNKYSLKPNKIKVKERTGAGDAFASGFVAGQIAGKSISESLKLGLKESESVIRYFGAKNNLIRMKLK
ncbi:carbohydrate kinase family protein [Candidatus Pacearchaeota archaeon]|nr:carbohydrate kinase family protein [Candidatus Pacearchaeota archaeon]